MDSKEKEFLEARLFDAVRQCEVRDIPRYVGFLDSAGAAVAVNAADRSKVGYLLFGGYEDAERVCFGVFPDRLEPSCDGFPIVKLKILNKSGAKLRHGDFLGALMALGIERDTVGDILVGEKTSFVFVIESVAEFIVSQLLKIGSCGVEVSVDTTDELPQSAGFAEMSDTVASKRLDCVVAALASCSRGQAAELIDSGLVAVNGLEVTKVTKEVYEKDVIAVRRKGKFAIDEISNVTKKGRLVLKYRKYI